MTREDFLEYWDPQNELALEYCKRSDSFLCETTDRAYSLWKGVSSDGRLHDHLRDLIEGMEVSIDVSTGDDDAGNRLFGTVSAVQDSGSSKHGVILLVQETEANF